MQSTFRIIDANINRASEGVRVLEDIARFYFAADDLVTELRKMRHNIRKSIMPLIDKCIGERDSIGDIGLSLSQNSLLDKKHNLKETLIANFKRLQESLRTIEELLKINGFDKLSKEYELMRFKSYNIEKNYLNYFESHDLKQQNTKQNNPKQNILNTDIYCITAESFSLGRSNEEVVKEILETGVKIIQYREKEKQMNKKLAECMKLREMTKEYGATLIINDDIHIAMIVKADGIHIGQDDLPIEKVRDLVGNEMIIGVSTHSPDQCCQAIKNGADYIGVGPIFKTYTKKDVCDPVGLEYLEYVVANTNIPFVAIGGIKESNLEQVLEKKPKMIAMVTEIVGASDIRQKIANIRSKINESQNK